MSMCDQSEAYGYKSQSQQPMDAEDSQRKELGYCRCEKCKKYAVVDLKITAKDRNEGITATLKCTLCDYKRVYRDDKDIMRMHQGYIKCSQCGKHGMEEMCNKSGLIRLGSKCVLCKHEIKDS